MPAEAYSVIFEGKTREGMDTAQAKYGLAVTFGLSADQIARMFATAPVVLRRRVSLEDASRLAASFNGTGALCRIVRHRPDPDEESPGSATISRPTVTPQVGKSPALSAEVIPHLFAGPLAPPEPPPGLRRRVATRWALAGSLPALYTVASLGLGAAGVWAATRVLDRLALTEPMATLAPIAVIAAVAALEWLLIAPLLSRRRPASDPLPLDPRREPVLQTFIGEIARITRSPEPARIEIEADLSLELRRDGRGRPVLRLGLPLVAGLTSRQLAGLLAREIARLGTSHGRGAARRLHALLRHLEGAADGLQRRAGRLHTFADDHPWSLPLLWPLRALVAAQAALFERMHAGALRIAGAAVNEIEALADQWQVAVAGSQRFRATAHRLLLLREAYESVYEDLSVTWADRSLVDDLPSMVTGRSVMLEAERRGRMDDALAEQAAGVAALVPDIERVEAAEQLGRAGVFTQAFPARHLLRNYPTLARTCTERFYRRTLGLDISRDQLLSREAMNATVRESRRRQQALGSYFREWFLPTRFVALPPVKQYLGLGLEQRRSRLQYLVTKLRRSMPDIQRLIEDYRRVWEQTQSAYAHEGDDGEAVTSGEADTNMLRLRLAQIEELLQPYDEIFTERLAISLSGVVRQSPGTTQVTEEIKRLLLAQYALIGVREAYDALRMETYRLDARSSRQAATPVSRSVERALARQFDPARLQRIETQVGHIRSALRNAVYPFVSAGAATISILQHIEDNAPPPSGFEIQDLLTGTGNLLGAIQFLHTRVMGRLAVLATDYEAALGIAPIRLVERGAGEHGAVAAGLGLTDTGGLPVAQRATVQPR